MKTIWNNKLCFALGMGLPGIGIVVSAIIRGEPGVKASLAGMFAAIYLAACTDWFLGAATM